MQEVTATIPHQLGREEARRRIEAQVSALRQQHGSMLAGLQENWTGDTMAFSLNAMGQSLSGRVAVADQAVHVSVAVPWYLKMLTGNLKSRLEQQGRLLLEQAPAK